MRRTPTLCALGLTAFAMIASSPLGAQISSVQVKPTGAVGTRPKIVITKVTEPVVVSPTPPPAPKPLTSPELTKQLGDLGLVVTTLGNGNKT